MKNTGCRFCNANLTKIFVDLGMSPLSNSFLSSDILKKEEKFYPLQALVCDKCFLVQLPEIVSPEKIFNNYAYFSSLSDTWLKHSENYVNAMLDRFCFDSNSLVVEIGSNDGYLLQYFKKKGIPILGIDPAANVVKVAEQKGIPTLVKFFSKKIANELLSENKKADLIVGNNVLAHVPNLNDFVEGLRVLLKPNGVITMEFPHLLQLIKQNQFDTIYHEHFSYFSFLTVQKIFSFHKLPIFDVEELSTHGGSLRIFAKHFENDSHNVSNGVSELLEKEKKFGLEDILTYTSFSEKVKTTKKNINEFFNRAKNENKKIVSYGASAKGNTLLNYCGIGTDFIDYAVDHTPCKQGLYLPGTHIPIKKPDKIHKTKPDYVLITPWNLKEEIMGKISYIRDWGGKIVIPIPMVMLFSYDFPLRKLKA